tara:strand:- start:1173 stop:2246 length:1074 start_codon:yes stop_codon:yes gene_type:complete
MKLKSNLNYNILILLLLFQKVFPNNLWINHGWEIFDYISDARSSSLANATTAFRYNQPGASLNNPLFLSNSKDDLSLTHQSRFAGLINNDLLGFQINRYKTPIQINILYQGIGQIPDTRNALLDWGNDGKFDTNDPGEGNGILDEGERLDKNKLTYFSQQQIGIHGSFQSKILNKKFGVAFKFLNHNLGSSSAIGVGIDIGYISKLGKIEIASVAKNIPASGLIWSNGDIEKSITKLSIGSHYKVKLENLPFEFDLMSKLDFNAFNNYFNIFKIEKNIKIEKCFAIEAKLNDKLYIRIGKDIFTRSTGGVGLIWENFVLDYAFLGSPYNGLGGNHHLITINISLESVLKMLANDKKE